MTTRTPVTPELACSRSRTAPVERQIATRLYLSEATVKGYVSRMLVKLGCANRTQAGLLAHDAGIVTGQRPS